MAATSPAQPERNKKHFWIAAAVIIVTCGGGLWFGNWAASKGRETLDKVVPPSQNFLQAVIDGRKEDARALAAPEFAPALSDLALAQFQSQAAAAGKPTRLVLRGITKVSESKVEKYLLQWAVKTEKEDKEAGAYVTVVLGSGSAKVASLRFGPLIN